MLKLAVVSVVLKGKALWRASKNGDKKWFIAMFILNTAGILPLVYLLTKKKKKAKK